MWWLVVIPPALWVGKKFIDAANEDSSKADDGALPSSPAVTFEERGDLSGPKVVVIGRTGAGKSSLINMLSERKELAVQSVGSTTRWVEGVPIEIGQRRVCFVDTPGYGEVFTSREYANRLVNWVQKNRQSIDMLILVLQADAKAHADDHRILQAVRQVDDRIPVMIVLSQADKVLPIREAFASETWLTEKGTATMKSRHVREKIDDVRRQFGLGNAHIEPATSDDQAFNRRRLLAIVGRELARAAL